MSNKPQPGVDFIGVTTPFYCTDGNGKFLFHKRSNKCRDEHGKWDSGAGRLEFGLSLEENVLKEVKEELGCDGEVLKQLPAHATMREWDGHPVQWVSVPFIVKVNPEEVSNNEPEKIDEIGWFDIDNLPEPMHPAVAVEIKMARNEFDLG